MNVGILKVSLRLPENTSLKGKRQVIKSLVSRVRNKFDVAVAEVDDNDNWRLAIIGVGCISNDKRHNNQVLSRVAAFIGNGRLEAELLDYEMEFIEV